VAFISFYVGHIHFFNAFYVAYKMNTVWGE